MSLEPAHPFQLASKSPGVTGRLIASAKRIKALIMICRIPLFLAAMLLFVAGFAISVSRLELAFADLAWGWVTLSALIFVPLSMVYGAVNFMIMARGAGHSVPFARSLKISCVAAFAEFLPIPGGAMVRGGAMMSHGSRAVDAAAHVSVNAVLWISCAAVAASLSLGLFGPVPLAIGSLGLAGIAVCSWWLATRAGLGLAIAALAMRMVGLFFAGARLLAAFLALGIIADFVGIYPFVFATILGSAAAIAPGGLGISETVAAAIATLSAIAPEAAFVAVGFNRVIGLAVSGFATGIITLFATDQRNDAA